MKLKLAITLLFLGLSVGCKPDAGAEAKAEAEVVAVPVETLTVTASDFVETVEVSGVAEPIHEIRVAAEAGGRVTKAPIVEGDTVEKGDLVIRVDAQLDSARVDVLQNQLSTARREYERTKMLAKEGLATPQQLDQAAAAVDSASLNIKQVRVGMGKSTVRSPFTGLVAEKFVEEGEYVGPGTPLAHIVDFETIVINTSVAEGDVASVKIGSTVQVWIPALEKHYEGIIERRGVLANASTRTFPVEVHIPNTAREILPGMRARVIIPRKTWENVVIVPRDAILQGYEAKEAMVAPSGETGEAALRVVELGPARGNRIVVTSGLQAGDRLIVKGHRGIVNGSKVKIVREVKLDGGGAPAVDEKPAKDGDELAATPDSEPATN